MMVLWHFFTFGSTDEKNQKEVKKCKTKRQVAIQYGLTKRPVYYHDRYICSYILRNLRI